MRRSIAALNRFIITPRVSKYRLFKWADKTILADSATVAIARDDDTSFGILHSHFHELWSLRMGTFLGVGNDPRYTPSTTFETFPFPEGLTPNIPALDYATDPRAIAIAGAAARLNELRESWLNPADLVVQVPEVVAGYPDRILPKDEAAAKELAKRTLTNLYNARPAWLDNAHRALNEAVADAYGWAQRAGSDKGNQTIFYFCGHGTFTGNPMLLCRDYGSQPLDRFDGALNFGGLCRGMEYLTPGYQLFLADACRTPDAIPDMLSGLPNAGHSAITPPSLNAGIPKAARQSVHFATSKLKPSYGKVGGMSFYAEALLRALAGGGAQNEFDMWVGTSGLQNALETYCIRQASEFGLEQEPDRIRNGRFAIHKPAKVEVPVYMTCDPDEALANKFSLTATRGTQVAMSFDYNPGTPPRRYIDFLLEPDKYEVSATFDATTPFVGGKKKDLMVFPPETPLCLAIEWRTP